MGEWKEAGGVGEGGWAGGKEVKKEKKDGDVGKRNVTAGKGGRSGEN